MIAGNIAVSIEFEIFANRPSIKSRLDVDVATVHSF